MLRNLLFITLVACGPKSSTGGGGGGGTGPGPSNEQVNKLPDGAPLVTPGEHMAYKLQLKGVDLATYDFNVGQVADYNGKQAITVQSHAKAIGFVSMVTSVDDTFTSVIDVATGRPLHWQTDEFAKNGKDKEIADIKFSERNGDSIPVTFHLNADAPVPEPQKASMPDVWDYNAFLIALRAWEGPVGSHISVEVFRSRYMWHVDAKIAGKEKMNTALGELPAVRIDAHTYKLAKDGTKFPDSDERDFSVWISDDDGRVPLRNTAKSDYGDVQLEITDYQPGNGNRLRN